MNWKVPARILLSLGCDPRIILRSLMGWPGYLRDSYRYARLHRSGDDSRFPFRLGNLQPLLLDKADTAGHMGVYFHQDLFVARLIYHRKPSYHLDIGSRIDGFIGHLLTFMDVEIVDVRPLTGIHGLSFIQADARNLNTIPDDSVSSLSCLHALEHFGLGRYGDEIDPIGWEKALFEMCRILAPGGILYLSVPVGEERVEFNGQRIFSIATISGAAEALVLKSVTFIDKTGVLDRYTDTETFQNSHGRKYEGDVGVFEFTKLAPGNDL